MHTGVRDSILRSLNEIFCALRTRRFPLYRKSSPPPSANLEHQVKFTGCRMLRAGDSLLYVLTAGDKKTGLASIAVWFARRIYG